MWQAGNKLGRFRLDREIGQGSHGVVWVATDTALDTPVAVKILHPWLTQDTAVRERFKRELLLARRVAHPGVCRLFDLHEEGDAFFITMDFVEGQTLLNVLKNEGRLLPARGIKIMRGVCQALAAAHNAGVIHRDLKPANIIVRAGDSPMILDFGTATAQDVSRVTRPGTAVGSMRFIAPEVFTGVQPSIKTDIYSLGVVAYVTFAGKLPYNAAAGAIEMLEMIRNQPPLRIDVMQPDVPAALADVVNKAMEKTPEARFADALAFDEALAAVERTLESSPSSIPVAQTQKTGDFSKWAPSGVIRDVMGKTAAQTPVVVDAKPTSSPSSSSAPSSSSSPSPSSSPSSSAPASKKDGADPFDSGKTVSSPAQAGQTVVDKAPDLSLPTHLPSDASADLPLVTGTSEKSEAPTQVVRKPVAPTPAPAPAEAELSAAFDSVLGEPKTDVTAKPEVPSVPTDPSREAATEEGPATLEEVAPDDLLPMRPLEPTVRIANFPFENDKIEPPKTGFAAFDKRLLAAAGGVVALLVVVGIVIGTRSSSTDAGTDAGSTAPVVVVAKADAGEIAKSADAGSAVVAAVVDAGTAAEVADTAPMVFSEDAGPEPVEPSNGGGATHAARPKGDAKIDEQIRQVRATMVKKGLLPADMIDVWRDLDKAHAANAKGNKKDAEKLVESAKASVDGQNVDRGFVMSKLGRFTKLYDKSKRPDIADKVEPLARKAGAAFAAGQYDAANKSLNAAFALVAKPK